MRPVTTPRPYALAAAALACAALLVPAETPAFDSRVAGTPALSDQPYGREAARTTYHAEHTPLMEAVLVGSGIPSAHLPSGGAPHWNEPRVLWVPADDTDITSLPAEPYSVIPVAPEDVLRLRPRAITPTMYAELPDFSYSLYDWITGNELCPPNSANNMGLGSIDECYEFKGWMGSLNSTHFPPQNTTMHWHYNQLAIEIGAQCKDYQTDMGYGIGNAGPIPAYLTNTLDCGDDGLCPGDTGYTAADSGEGDGLDDFLVQCQSLQLMLEAIAQHYLQDAWSSGHMWQRWGGPMPTDILSKERGMAVAMGSGIIHGAKAISTFNDRQCAGSTWRYAWGSEGRTGNPPAFVNPQTTIVTNPNAYNPVQLWEGLGDLFLPTLDAGGGTVWTACLPRSWNTVYQKTKLYDCASLSARQAYDAGPKIYGNAGPYWTVVPDTNDARCLAARATNERMYHGSQLDLNVPLPFAGCDFDFNATAIWGVLSYVSSPSPSEVLLLKAEMNRIYNTLWAANWSWSRDDEFDASTNTGTYKLGTFMGIADNGAHNSVAPYADPAAPWDGLDPLGAADEEEVALLRAFNRSFPEYWCHRDRMGVPELNQLRRKCQGLGSYSTLDADAKEASCQVCEEFSARHIRIGCSETDDTYTDVTIDRQPVCGLVGDPADADFLYLDLDPTVPEANDAALAATEFCRSNAPSYGPCVDLFLFGDYDTAFCSVVYWPFYQCLGCGSCLPVGSYMTIIDSPYEEADLNWTWSFWGGYPSDVNDLSGSFVYDVLTPYYCGVTVTGNAGLSIEVWDPYYASSSTAFDTATSSCFGG